MDYLQTTISEKRIATIKHELDNMDIYLTGKPDKEKVLDSIEEIRFQLNQIVYLLDD